MGESAPRSALEEPLACEVKESEGTKPWGPGAWQMVLKRWGVEEDHLLLCVLKPLLDRCMKTNHKGPLWGGGPA